MANQDFISTLKSINIDFFTNYKMAQCTTMKTGGEADYFSLPSSLEALISCIETCQNYSIPYLIMGNGSNILVSDSGLRKMVIATTNMKAIDYNDGFITAEAGAKLGQIGAFALENELTGFEFAAGIPGTLGGGIFMNAGAYGGELSSIVDLVYYYEKGESKSLPASGCGFSYRHSIFCENDSVILKARIKLEKGSRDEISSKMRELAKRRKDKQPLEFPSCGSVFKRPAGYFAGKLIEDAGLAGASVGGAEVSRKHCGFIINTGGATTEDILNLIEMIKEKVYDKFKVSLEPEVKVIK